MKSIRIERCASIAPALLLVWSLFCPAAPILAQEPSMESASVREVLETGEKTEQLLEERSRSEGAGAAVGATPLATILSLTETIREEDYGTAAAFLDMRYLPDELDEWTPEELIRAINIVWSQQNIVDISALSDEPQGDVNDGLPLHLELLGTLTIDEEEIPVLLQSVPTADGSRVWKIANSTVARIPELWDEWGYSPLALYLGEVLPDISFAGMENWQLLFTLVFFLLAWPVSVLVSEVLLRGALLIPNDFPTGIERFFRGPIRFFTFILLARLLIEQLNLSLTARIFLSSSGIDYIAFTVLVMGGLSLLRDYHIRKLQRLNQPQYAALLKPITTVVKLLVLTVIALFWAESAGYNMTTILAGLGIGSLAVALAAQKTLENIFGAITLYLARPVKAGDFCRFRDVLGWVEEIGLRSTTLRTLDNTLVYVPNSEFSSSQVENITARGAIRFNTNLRVKLVSADRLDTFLRSLRELFQQPVEVTQEAVSVRLKRIEEDTAVIWINLQVNTQNYEEYLSVCEGLNLQAIRLAEQHEMMLSGPSLTVNVEKPA